MSTAFCCLLLLSQLPLMVLNISHTSTFSGYLCTVLFSFNFLMMFMIKKSFISRGLKPETLSRTKKTLLKHIEEQKFSFLQGIQWFLGYGRFLKYTCAHPTLKNSYCFGEGSSLSIHIRKLHKGFCCELRMRSSASLKINHIMSKSRVSETHKPCTDSGSIIFLNLSIFNISFFQEYSPHVTHNPV